MPFSFKYSILAFNSKTEIGMVFGGVIFFFMLFFCSSVKFSSISPPSNFRHNCLKEMPFSSHNASTATWFLFASHIIPIAFKS